MMLSPEVSGVSGLGCGLPSRVPSPAARMTTWMATRPSLSAVLLLCARLRATRVILGSAPEDRLSAVPQWARPPEDRAAHAPRLEDRRRPRGARRPEPGRGRQVARGRRTEAAGGPGRGPRAHRHLARA